MSGRMWVSYMYEVVVILWHWMFLVRVFLVDT